MSSLRQSELLAGNDWRVLYQAFTNINFNASDPPTINLALREFVRLNYPEDFNDWIESSEFVALIDLLSWLAGTLAFRTDINARENLLDTAEARESILRLARFLSYTVHRNQTARGLVKIVAVQTDDDVIDSFGVNLNSQVIQWNDPDNPDWFEQLTLVLNSAFIATNPFGIPLKSGLVSAVKTQLYRVNNAIGTSGTYAFNSLVGGTNMDFDVVNLDFTINGGFFEQSPDFETAFHLAYRNDGNGNTSPDTGFFLLFKQGTLNSKTFQITTPIENQVIDINTSNINQTDVWVQTVADDGSIMQDWTPVPVLITDNITFNSVPIDVRNIYSVVTRDNDQISLRFSDGRFGTVPTGNIRAWFRTSNGLQYQIRPQDMDRIKINIPYINRNNVSKNLTLTFSLQSSVTNSIQRETNEQVRRRAPQVFGTQDRMVSGEDYNIFPLQGNLAVKLKAVNRVYAGHSRFIDLNDPTGTYQDTNVFADDGIFYSAIDNAYDEVPLLLNKTSQRIIEENIQPILSTQSVQNYLRNELLLNHIVHPSNVYWHQSTVAKFSSTGVFSSTAPALTTIAVGPTTSIDEGALLKFTDFGWAAVNTIAGNGTSISPTGQGSVLLTVAVPADSSVEAIIPAMRMVLTTDERSLIQTRIDNHFSFNLAYNVATLTWVVNDLNVVAGIPILTAEYIAGLWRIRTLGLRYIFESEQNVRWFFDQGFHAINQQTGLAARDTIRVLAINSMPTSGQPLGVPYDLYLDRQFFYNDGYAEPRRVQITFADSDSNDIPDDPETFINIIGPTIPDNLLFWQLYTAPDGNQYSKPLDGVIVFANDNIRTVSTGVANGVYYVVPPAPASQITGKFWLWNSNTVAWQAARIGDYSANTGRGGNRTASLISPLGAVTPLAPTPLSFQWKHYAPNDHRIDPAPTNFIDIFVLDTTYDQLVRQWIGNGAPPASIPPVPTQIELAVTFAQFEPFKTFSDEIIWRPVRYKYLFGSSGTLPELRAQFKVIVLPTTTLSSGEIQSQIIRTINTFFDSTNWDFGDTFYFTELSAFVHRVLANVVGSFVIVPLNAAATFGDMFEVKCQSDEIFISTAQVADVVIINANTASNLRIRQ